MIYSSTPSDCSNRTGYGLPRRNQLVVSESKLFNRYDDQTKTLWDLFQIACEKHNHKPLFGTCHGTGFDFKDYKTIFDAVMHLSSAILHSKLTVKRIGICSVNEERWVSHTDTYKKQFILTFFISKLQLSVHTNSDTPWCPYTKH